MADDENGAAGADGADGAGGGDITVETKVKILSYVFLAFAVVFLAGAALWFMSTRGAEEVLWIRARHVLIKVEKDANEAAWAAALKKIDLVKEKLDGGADFEKVAAEYSDCPSKAKGGDLGWNGRGGWVKEFEEAAWGAKVGELVGPVRTDFGYHLIEVRETSTSLSNPGGPPRRPPPRH